MKTFATSPKVHKDVPQLTHQRFTPSFNLCPSRQMDVLDTASRASRRISSESLRKISFRILSDLARLMTVNEILPFRYRIIKNLRRSLHGQTRAKGQSGSQEAQKGEDQDNCCSKSKDRHMAADNRLRQKEIAKTSSTSTGPRDRRGHPRTAPG